MVYYNRYIRIVGRLMLFLSLLYPFQETGALFTQTGSGSDNSQISRNIFLGGDGGREEQYIKGGKKISFGSLPFFPRTFIVLLYCGKVYTPVHIIIYIS